MQKWKIKEDDLKKKKKMHLNMEGTSFAREALNLIDNLERSKHSFTGK